MSFSGSVSFDALCNQVLSGSKSYNSLFFLFANVLYLMDSNFSTIDTFSLDMRVILMPSVDTSVEPPLISGQVRFQILLDGGGVKKNESVVFSLNNSGLCVSESEFRVSPSDSSVSQKMKDLNFFQILSKVTVFYKVFLFLRSNAKWVINFQTGETKVSLLFSSCSPRKVEVSTDVAKFSFENYYNYLRIGARMLTILPAFNMKLDPRIVVRVLENINFKGSFTPFPSSGTKLTVSNIVNFDSDINVFDSIKMFQPNRIRLKSFLVSEYLEFDDFSYDFLDLTKEVQTPSLLNCSVTDSSNTCIRCIH